VLNEKKLGNKEQLKVAAIGMDKFVKNEKEKWGLFIAPTRRTCSF